MPRSFIINLDEPIKTINVVAEEILAPTFDNLMPVLEVDGVTLLGTTMQTVTAKTYYEQVLNRFKTMNINGSQQPYILTTDGN